MWPQYTRNRLRRQLRGCFQAWGGWGLGTKQSLIRDIPDAELVDGGVVQAIIAGQAFRNGRAISAWAEAIAAHNPMPDAQLA